MQFAARRENPKKLVRFLIMVPFVVMGFLCFTLNSNLGFDYFGKQSVSYINFYCSDLSVTSPEDIYILIDESFSANSHDPYAKLRYSTAQRIVEFVTSYGWIAEKPPQIFIYQYSEKFTSTTGYTNQIWPIAGMSPVVTLEKPNDSDGNYVTDIENLLDSEKTSRSGAQEVEDLTDSLKSLEDLIVRQGDSKNSLAIIITEGYPLPKGSPESLEMILERAAYNWNGSPVNGVPIGIVLYSSNPGRLETLSNAWENSFLKELRNPNLPHSLPILELQSDTSDYVGVWNWMITLYERIGMFRSTGVNVGELDGTNKFEVNFLGPANSFSISSYWGGEQEKIVVTDESAIGEVLRPNVIGNLEWWKTPISGDNFSIRPVTKKAVVSKFIYQCQPQTSNPSAPTTVPSIIPTLQVVPTSAPKGNQPINVVIGSGSVSLVVLAVLLLVVYLFRAKWQNHPLVVVGSLLIIMDFGLAIYIVASRGYVWLLQNLIANILYGSLFTGFSGATLWWAKGFFVKLSGKSELALLLLTPILAGMLVFLFIVLVIMRLP